MIFLKLKVDNLYMFRDAEVDFTYPRRNKDSLIEGEYLEAFPQVRFKRVCIIMGANASGKTTFGRLLCAINNFVMGRPLSDIKQAIYDSNRPGVVDVLYIVPHFQELRRLRVEVDKLGLVSETLWSTPLRKSLSLERMEQALTNSKPAFEWTRPDKAGLLESAFLVSQAIMQDMPLDSTSGWHYIFSEIDVSSENLAHGQQDLPLLQRVLQAFDTSIESVKPSQDKNNAYVIAFRNGDRVIVEDGELRETDRQRLSRGTLESIEVAKLLSTIIRTGKLEPEYSGTFFLDEKMAYSHTEMEKSILNVMIERLGRHSQLFYTTHNHDILSMALPSHSFLFMRKDDFVEFAQPEKMGLTKNDRNLLGYVRNDVFGTLPDTTRIDELLEDE